MADKKYRTFIGVVQFDPRDAEAGGKPIRNITIRQAGLKDQAVNVSATLWPSHAHVPVEKGDVVIVDGSFTTNQGTTAGGEPRTYFNLSVSSIANLGKVDFGQRVDVENAAPENDDEVPY